MWPKSNLLFWLTAQESRSLRLNTKAAAAIFRVNFWAGVRDNLHMSLYRTFTETHIIHSRNMYPSPYAATLAIRILVPPHRISLEP